MRVLLDNCVPVDLAPHIRGHEVSTAVAMGWANLNDCDLLDVMAGEFDALVTVDSGIHYQQIIAGRPIAVVILRARSNRVEHLARLVSALHRELKLAAAGDVRVVGTP